MMNLCADVNSCDTRSQGQNSEQAWSELYPLLRSLARHLVYSFHVPCWHGQEEDFTDDIVQETIRRAIERIQRSERGELTPVHSLKHMLVAILYNYCKDLRRHDLRLTHILPNDGINECQLSNVMPDEDAIDNVYCDALFRLLTQEIANFPKKQRRALLIDLANMTYCGEELTPLQEAFLAVGIDLHQYQQPLPENARERDKHASLLCHAYKRVAQLPRVQMYVSAV